MIIGPFQHLMVNPTFINRECAVNGAKPCFWAWTAGERVRIEGVCWWIENIWFVLALGGCINPCYWGLQCSFSFWFIIWSTLEQDISVSTNRRNFLVNTGNSGSPTVKGWVCSWWWSSSDQASTNEDKGGRKLQEEMAGRACWEILLSLTVVSSAWAWDIGWRVIGLTPQNSLSGRSDED